VDSETPSTSTGHAERAPNALLARKNDLFGPSPVIQGEDPAVYEKLLAGFMDSVKPADILEEMWVREAVDLHWEVLRLRRLKTQFLQGRAYRGVERIANLLKPGGAGGLLAQRWARKEAAARKEVNALLASAGLTVDAAMAEALVLTLEEIERIDYLVASADERRNNAIREIDRRHDRLKAALGKAMRAEDAEDADFTEIAGPGAAPPPSSV
jgi:hypothetical protein